MSGHARQAFVDGEAENHFYTDHQHTLLHNGEPVAEIHSENEDRRMSDMGQATELLNGKEQRGCRSPPCAAGPTESNSNSDEEQQNQLIQLPNGREPRRWITGKEWTRYIQEDAHCPHLRNRQPSVVSIFRVPKFLKVTKREAYVPGRVSLGPYHHGSAELPGMGHHKRKTFRRMMKGFNAYDKNLPVDPYDMDFANRAREQILKLENEIRDSYEENIDCDGETLARMLCLDGCFLLEVLRTLGLGPDVETGNYYDPIFGEYKLCYAAKDVLDDILMLENQVPFIVLGKLLELELNSAVDVNEELLNRLKGILKFVIPFKNMQFDEKQWPCHHHLLCFLHTVIVSTGVSTTLNKGEDVDKCNCCIPGVSTTLNKGEDVDKCNCCIHIDCCSSQCIRLLPCKSKTWNEAQIIPPAVELTNAGIKFVPIKGGIHEIKFEKNTILLPSISIQDNTEIVLRNLIAFEMCKPSQINYVSCYVSLMDDLIDSEKDVALLRRMGVITNYLGSDKEVADLFNGLCKGVTMSQEEGVISELKINASEHYNNEMKVQIEKLVQEHFSSPWKALALMAAIVILLLTLLQTIFTII